jgi:hypothetical protein
MTKIDAAVIDRRQRFGAVVHAVGAHQFDEPVDPLKLGTERGGDVEPLLRPPETDPAGSRTPERLRAFPALLDAGYADIPQIALAERGEQATLPRTVAPDRYCVDDARQRQATRLFLPAARDPCGTVHADHLHPSIHEDKMATGAPPVPPERYVRGRSFVVLWSQVARSRAEQ